MITIPMVMKQLEKNWAVENLDEAGAAVALHDAFMRRFPLADSEMVKALNDRAEWIRRKLEEKGADHE